MRYFESSDGVRLAWRDEGSARAGVPLLCLSGLTRNSADFDFVAPHLKDVRLIRMDYRGRGASQWADPASYTVAREAQDALELLDHLGIERAAILGTSRGGLIAMTLAAAARERLAAVILNDIGPEIAPEGIAFIRGYIGRPPPWKTLAEAATARAALPGFEGVPPARWQAEARNLYEETPEGLKLRYDPALAAAFADADASALPDLWPLFDALEGVPLGLIRGANSNILSRETAAGMRARRPDMAFAEVPGRGHVPFLDEPEALGVIEKVMEEVR